MAMPAQDHLQGSLDILPAAEIVKNLTDSFIAQMQQRFA
jgi:hypothetical protein